MGEGNTGENNQGLGMMSDQGHKRKGKLPETRGEHEFHKTKNPRQDIPNRHVTPRNSHILNIIYLYILISYLSQKMSCKF